MSNYISTEKSLKRWLKTKVKITIATVIGFLITGTVVAAATMANQEQGVYDNTEVMTKVKSTKFIKGKDGNLELYTNGSTGTLLQNLKDNHGSIEKIIEQLGVQDDGKNLVVVGALAGEGKYSEGVREVQYIGKIGNTILKDPKLDKILGILNRTNTTTVEMIQGDINTTIGNEKTSPLVLGLIGGDMTVGVGKIDTNIKNIFDLRKLFSSEGGIVNSLKEQENLKITREGNTVSIINNGNVFGGSVGSTALSLGSIATKGKKQVKISDSKTATLNYDLKLNGNTTSTINGNTSLNINGPANAAGITAGGLAAAIGGSATSNITGNSDININSKVNSGELEGLTVGIFGGGMSASTLGGTANTTTSGEININITNGLNVGLAGSGLAVSTDASQYLVDGFKGGKIENGNFIIDPDGLPPITVSALKEGGTSNVTSGDTKIALNGTTSAAGVIGSGIAISHQNSGEGKASSSVVKTNNTNIDINVKQDMNGEKLAKNGVFSKFKNLASNLKNIVDPNHGTNVGNLIGSMKAAAESVQDKGMVVGVLGNGIAIARDKASATVEAQDTTLNLKSGYIVGVAGNGIASGNATSEVKANSSTINIDGAEVIGLTGSGIALNHRVVAGEQSSEANIAETTVNVNSGSVDGIFGGGIAITKDDTNSKANVTTSGKSTININGGEVDKFGFQHIKGIIGTHGSYDKIAEAGKDVAISAGGVTSRNGVTSVKESEININNGTVIGNILAGGIAVSGGISTVDKSVINITGGNIQGNVIGTGIAIKEDNKVGKINKEKTEATVGESILNIDGYNGKINKISDFNFINIGSNKLAREQSSKETNLTITDQIDVGSGKLSNTGTINFENTEKDKALLKVVDGSAVNEGTIVIDAGSKVAENKTGTVKNLGKIKVKNLTDKDNFKVKNLFTGDYTDIGLILDESGNPIIGEGEIVVSGKVTTGEILENAKIDKIILENVTLSGTTPLNPKSINVIGKVENSDNLEIADSKLNISKDGIFAMADKDITIKNSVINGEKDKSFVSFGDNSVLNLDSVTLNSGIIGNTPADKKGTINFTGKNSIDGEFNANNINIEKGSDVALSSNSKGSGVINLNGNIGLGIGKENKDGRYTQNFFYNSNGNVEVNGNGSVTLDTSNLTGKNLMVDIGDKNTFGQDLTTKLDTTNIYKIDGDIKNGEIKLTYNDVLFGENNPLSQMNLYAMDVNDEFDNIDVKHRERQLDNLRTASIYSETIRAAYDNMKLSEEAILSLPHTKEVGTLVANGKALYGHDKYEKTGLSGDYKTKIESKGLMATLEYGLSDTTVVGFGFGGTKQDVKIDGGNSDGDVFYLGVYGNKNYGNTEITVGAAYQLGKYDSENKAGQNLRDDSYDSKGMSLYVQGKYKINLEQNLSLEPKVKLGYNYIKQDDAQDKYFGVEDAEVTTFDIETGADLVKTVRLEKTKADFKVGVAYVRTFGDTDENFTGSFRRKDGGRNRFEIMGPNLAENIVKIGVGTEVESDTGIFYNGNIDYRIGSDNTKEYRASVGVGFKF